LINIISYQIDKKMQSEREEERQRVIQKETKTRDRRDGWKESQDQIYRGGKRGGEKERRNIGEREKGERERGDRRRERGEREGERHRSIDEGKET
jgi:hypothetical protein